MESNFPFLKMCQKKCLLKRLFLKSWFLLDIVLENAHKSVEAVKNNKLLLIVYFIQKCVVESHIMGVKCVRCWLEQQARSKRHQITFEVHIELFPGCFQIRFVWSHVTVNDVCVFLWFNPQVSALALDPSGARLVTGGYDFDVKFWDFAGMDAALHAFRSLQPCEWWVVSEPRAFTLDLICLEWDLCSQVKSGLHTKCTQMQLVRSCRVFSSFSFVFSEIPTNVWKLGVSRYWKPIGWAGTLFSACDELNATPHLPLNHPAYSGISLPANGQRKHAAHVEPIKLVTLRGEPECSLDLCFYRLCSSLSFL